MGKRVIIKGADFSQNAASTEAIMNLLSVSAIEQLGSVALAKIGNDEYYFNRGNGHLGQKVSGAMVDKTSELSNYDGLVFMDVPLILNGGTRYNVAYPSDYEEVSFSTTYRYDYNSETGVVTQNSTTSGFYGGTATLNAGDLLVFVGAGGTLPRGIVVKTPDNSTVIYVSNPGDPATGYAPFFYLATQDCVVYLNRANTNQKTYIRRA